jgi:FAD/FMN-containing dehydrogenase
MSALPPGRHFSPRDDGYEQARRATVWNQRVPDRYPEVIVQARDADDVVGAIAYAKANGLQVGIRSGGHNWAANHLRDGGVLLDVHRLDHSSIDAERKVAVVGPGKGDSVLAAELDAVGLFFPAGHCKGVCVGGYLLQGGYGWNSRVFGPACENVIGLDVVTADGEKIYCDADSHPDLYWAARGAGPGLACRAPASTARQLCSRRRRSPTRMRKPRKCWHCWQPVRSSIRRSSKSLICQRICRPGTRV